MEICVVRAFDPGSTRHPLPRTLRKAILLMRFLYLIIKITYYDAYRWNWEAIERLPSHTYGASLYPPQMRRRSPQRPSNRSHSPVARLSRVRTRRSLSRGCRHSQKALTQSLQRKSRQNEDHRRRLISPFPSLSPQRCRRVLHVFGPPDIPLPTHPLQTGSTTGWLVIVKAPSTQAQVSKVFLIATESLFRSMRDRRPPAPPVTFNCTLAPAHERRCFSMTPRPSR